MFATIKVILIRIIAVVATLFAIGMLYWGYPLLRSVFRLTDPTGMFGTSCVLLGFLSNLLTIFALGVFLRHAIISKSWRERMPTPFKIIFLLKVFEAINVLPCLSGHPGELCGASSVFISYLSSPVIAAAGWRIIFGTADVTIRRAGQAMLALILILGFAGWELITPKNAQECGLMYELADRAVCAERFALSKADMRICRDIDFRSVQYDCMERVAQMLRKPELCEEIKAPPGARITRFEVKPDIFKDTCYYGLALSLHDKGLCGKIGDEKMTAACKGRMSTAGTIDPPEGVRGDGSGLPPQ